MIPTTPDDFTPGWLAEKLGAAPESLRGFTAKPLGTGQMSDSFRLTLEWDGQLGPASIIAKCPSHDERSRNIARTLTNYVKEVSWYRELAQLTSVPRPHCYHAEMDDNGVDFALLMSDCAPASQADQLAGAGPAQLLPAVDALAALHAPFWNGDVVIRYPWLVHDSRDLIITALPSLAEGFADRYALRLAPDIIALARTFAGYVGRYLDWQGSASTVVHGDFRLDNLLFAPDRRSLYVVDWQTLGFGCPFADLAYLIGTSIADAAERAAAEIELFDRYLAALAHKGVNTDRAAALSDYRVYALSGVMMAIFASMNVERTERGDEMFAVMAERPARQALALGSLEMLRI